MPKKNKNSGIFGFLFPFEDVSISEFAIISTVSIAAAFASVYLVRRLVLNLHFNIKHKNAAQDRTDKLKKLSQDKNENFEKIASTFTKYEDVVSRDIVLPQNIDISFDKIGGHGSLKQQIKEIVILPFARPELFSKGNLLKPPSGILLCGPPGTGKTMLAKAIAKETKAVFINLQISTIEDMWFGESQQLVKAVFTLAAKMQPTIIFIDEIDGILSSRHSNHEHHVVRNIKSEFMNLWDGINTNKNNYIIIIGATNRSQDIDPAFMRRMPLQLNVGLPDITEREHILKIILADEDIEENFDYKEFARLTENFSGSDLKELCRRAAYGRVRDFLKSENNTSNSEQTDEEKGRYMANNLRKITTNDFLEALDQSEKEKQSNLNENPIALLQRFTSRSIDVPSSNNNSNNNVKK